MKVGSDSVLLGSWITVNGTERNVLDIGTGTGLLALMTAQRTLNAKIVAVEIDLLAYEQACENISRSKWSERITVVNADINDYHPQDCFDLIISNPPYFENSLKSMDTRKNFARHDDSLSLQRLIDCVHRLLSDSGRFALILPAHRISSIVKLAETHSLFPVKQLNVKPKDIKPVNRVIMEFGRKQEIFEENTLTLRTDTGKYSDDYKHITTDFYKHLREPAKN
jgi:tRNA1Val (adenine37-N6)-methyltransferase